MINVLYQFDDKYLPYGGVSIYSLLSNCSKDVKVRIFCAGLDISEDNKDKMEQTVKSFNQELVWLDCEAAIDLIKEMRLDAWNGSIATWIKMFIIHKMPEDVDRLLYLDSDTIITGDISKIDEIDLGEYPVAAAYDCLSEYLAKKIGLNVYYNAGVILFNVKKWREQGFYDEFFAHVKKTLETNKDRDQGLLNDYFRGRTITLSPIFNMQGFMYAYKDAYFKAYKNEYFYSSEEIVKAQENPIVVHFFRFLGDYPWESKNLHPCSALFHEWKEKTLWKDFPDLPERNILMFKIEKVLYKCLPKVLFLKIFRFVTER